MDDVKKYFINVGQKLYEKNSYDYFSVLDNRTDPETENKNMTINPDSYNYYPWYGNYFCGMMVHFKRAKLFSTKSVNKTSSSINTNTNASIIATENNPITDAMESDQLYSGAEIVNDYSNYLIFESKDLQPFDGKSFYSFFGPHISPKISQFYNDQIIAIFDKKLFYFSYNFMIFNSQHQIVLMYKLRFTQDTFGEILHKRDILGFQPLLSTNQSLFVGSIILNIFLLIGIWISAFYIVRTFIHNIVDWIKLGSSYFQLFDFLDVFVTILCLTSLIMFYESFLFIRKTFPISLVNEEEYIYWMNYAFHIKNYNRINGITLFFLMIRISSYLHASFPNFGIVKKTISNAKIEIFTFVVLLFIVLLGFVLMAHVSFGNYSDDNKFIEDSVISIYLMFLGIYDFFEIFNNNYSNPLAPYFLIFFMFFFNIILINIFFAIIRKSYAEIKKVRQRQDEAYALLLEESSEKYRDNIFRLLTCKKPPINPSSSNYEENSKIPTNDEKIENQNEECLKIFQTNIERLELDKIFKSKSLLSYEETQLKKREKYEIIDKLKIHEIANDLKINKVEDFDLLVESIIFLVFIVVFIIMIVLQTYVHNSNDIKTYVNQHYLQNLPSGNNISNFQMVKNYTESLMKSIFNITDIESNDCSQFPTNTFLSTNESIPKYIYLNGPYFRLTYRIFKTIDNTGSDSNYFSKKVYSSELLSEENCPGNNDYNSDFNFITNISKETISYYKPKDYHSYNGCGGKIIHKIL